LRVPMPEMGSTTRTNARGLCAIFGPSQMDLATHLLALVAPLATGDEIAPGVRLASVSSELGLRITFDCSGREVHVEVAPEQEGGRFAARTNKLLFRYRDEGGRAGVDPRVGLALCRAVAARAALQEERVLDAIAREAAAAREHHESGMRVREVQVSRLLEPAGSPVRRYYTLSPYVGCLVGCRFCYAQSRVGEVRRMTGLPDAPWGSYVDVRVNAPEVLEAELAALPARPIKFCPIISDPYHAVERRYAITRACLQVLRDATEPRAVLLLTRCRLIERDLELIRALPLGYVGVSIPTADDAVRHHFEPRGASIDERLELLRAFARAGVRTFAMVQPLLPGSIPALADALAGAVESASIDVLRGVEGAAEEFADPRYAFAQEPRWQEDHAAELAEALGQRKIAVWTGDLPPELS
jgi:DNA repair photolyase